MYALKNNIINSLYNQISIIKIKPGYYIIKVTNRITNSWDQFQFLDTKFLVNLLSQIMSLIQFIGSFDIKLIIDNTNYIEFYVNEIEFKSSNIEDTININLNIDELDIEKYNPNYIFKYYTWYFKQ